jgi:hypothetical protein
MIDIRQHDLDRQAAERHQHPREAMRVLMECGHIRLMPQVDTVQGVGALTGCAVCVPEPGQRTVERLVVDVQETGKLFYDTMYRPRVETPPVPRDLTRPGVTDLSEDEVLRLAAHVLRQRSERSPSYVNLAEQELTDTVRSRITGRESHASG